MNICIIPARGGSKRIPFKNIKNFRGKPIIAWSIESALATLLFDKVIVSTDDPHIAKVAIEYGAEVPFFRPDELADDFVGTAPVVRHAIQHLDLPEHDAVLCLYATAPFTTKDDLLASLRIFNLYPDDSPIFSATSFPFPIQRGLRIDKSGYSSPIYPEKISMRSQDLEEFYHDAGQFYLATAKFWNSGSHMFQQGRPLLLPRWRVQDIDTLEDWKRAELMHAAIEELS